MYNSIEARYKIVQERTLPVIASEIQQIERTVYGVAMDGAIQIGQKLKEAKAMIPAGEWVKWLSENLNYSQRQAYNFMEIADGYGDENSPYFNLQTSANLSISKALELLRLPEDTVESFAKEHDIESETVKSLRDEISILKAQKEAADHKAAVIEGNNDNIRKELASLQRKLSDSVSEEEFTQMQEAAQAQKEDLQKELAEAKASSLDIQAKLDKAKEDLRKQKDKLKAIESSRDEEIRSRLAESEAEREASMKEEIQKRTAEATRQLEEDLREADEEIERLQRMADAGEIFAVFKVQTQILQDAFGKICEVIEDIRAEDLYRADRMAEATGKLMDLLQEKLRQR